MSRNTEENERRKSVEGMESVSPLPSDGTEENHDYDDLLYDVRMIRAGLSVLTDVQENTHGYGYHKLYQLNGILFQEIESTIQGLDEIITTLQAWGGKDIEAPA